MLYVLSDCLCLSVLISTLVGSVLDVSVIFVNMNLCELIYGLGRLNFSPTFVTYVVKKWLQNAIIRYTSLILFISKEFKHIRSNMCIN